MFEGQIKQTDAMTVAYLAMRGSYSQIPESLGRLYGWVAQTGMTPVGMPQSVYHTTPGDGPEEEWAWEVWAPVAPDVEPQEADETGLGIKEVPAGKAAAAMHIGPYETIDQTYGALADWIEGKGLRVSGPPREVYLSDPAEVAPEDTQTEILFPILD
jgi:effector-binding domain-containing protein